MVEKKVNLDSPFQSVRRIPTKPENICEPDNAKTKTTTRSSTKIVKGSRQESEHETLVRLLKDDQSFNDVMEPSSVPFLWEKTPEKPKTHHHHMDATLIEDSDLIKALDMVSSSTSFSFNCSTKGVSNKLEENEDRSSNVSRDEGIIEYRYFLMSRFLSDAKAIAIKQIKESSRIEEMQKKKKKQSIALQRVSMAINQDLKNNDDSDHNNLGGIDEAVYSNVSKKAMSGFLPRFCSQNSLDVLNPVLSRVRTCQNIRVKPGKIINPKSQDSVCKTKSVSPRILRSSMVMSKSQDIIPIQRFSTEISRMISLSKSGEIVRIPRNHSRLQRALRYQIQKQDTRFLLEEVKKRSNRNRNRSENLSSVSQPPLPKTPSESWLCRTLPKSSTASVISGKLAVAVSGQAASFKKMDQKSIIWETIVKTSHKHQDHVYSEDLIVVHPSRQRKP